MSTRDKTRPPAPTHLTWGERKTASWQPLFWERLAPGKPPALMLVQDLAIRIEPEPWLPTDKQTTAVNLVVPEGTLIPWSTPPSARRAQLVLAHFATRYPRKVMRWIEQLLDADASPNERDQ